MGTIMDGVRHRCNKGHAEAVGNGTWQLAYPLVAILEMKLVERAGSKCVACMHGEVQQWHDSKVVQGTSKKGLPACVWASWHGAETCRGSC